MQCLLQILFCFYWTTKEPLICLGKGELILVSGNIVHNLVVLRFPESSTYDWAIDFDEQSQALIEKGDHQSLVDYQKLGQAAELSIPTPDHY